MSEHVIIFAISSLITGLLAEPAPTGMQWAIDKDEVYVGGCVAIRIPIELERSGALAVRIDEQEPVQLLDGAGPVLNLSNSKVVLLSHISGREQSYRPVPGRPETFQTIPVFNTPGVVRLTLEVNGIPQDVKTVNVLVAPPLSQRAISVLYPEITRGVGAPIESKRLLYLLTRGSLSAEGGADERTVLEKVREVLPDLRNHPDWAEIFDALVARLDAENYRRSITMRDDDPPFRIKDDIEDLPSVPESVTRCLQQTPKSPFAGAIQDKIRGLRNDVDRLDQARRLERDRAARPSP